MSKGSLTFRDLLKKLKPYGIVVLSRKRGKGSESILLKPNALESRKGSIYPVKNHGPSTEITAPVINAILRRFGIDKKVFW